MRRAFLAIVAVFYISGLVLAIGQVEPRAVTVRVAPVLMLLGGSAFLIDHLLRLRRRHLELRQIAARQQADFQRFVDSHLGTAS